ncbi:hypothetical protein VC87395_000651 [Vibrio paracholerae 87395]|nr:hypothetical protein VC87395_000651 [Vibrio paracholerae 87395]
MSDALENRVITERLLAATAMEPSSTDAGTKNQWRLEPPLMS